MWFDDNIFYLYYDIFVIYYNSIFYLYLTLFNHILKFFKELNYKKILSLNHKY